MDIAEAKKRFLANNIRGLSKVLTMVESRTAGFEKLMSEITPQKGSSYCLGITGPPGAGKSTLVDGLTHLLRKAGKTVAILAIDPSSPFSGGAVLGDRIRMQDHAGDEGVFIRSIGSRGSHGGLSRATRDMTRVLVAFGFDIVIVETVGVGQTELDIMELADTTIVVLVPEAGDTIQTMKAGLLEIADIFVVNKCDRPGSDQIKRGLAALVEMSGSAKWSIPVLETEAQKKIGIDELLKIISKHKDFVSGDSIRKERQKEIRKAELFQICVERFEQLLKKKFSDEKKFNTILRDVENGKLNAYGASISIIKKLVGKDT